MQWFSNSRETLEWDIEGERNTLGQADQQQGDSNSGKM